MLRSQMHVELTVEMEFTGFTVNWYEDAKEDINFLLVELLHKINITFAIMLIFEKTALLLAWYSSTYDINIKEHI